MKHAIWFESRCVLGLAAFGLLVSLAAFLFVTRSGVISYGNSASTGRVQMEGPPPAIWEPTGEFRSSVGETGLTVVSFSVNSDRMAVLFALDAASQDRSIAPGRVYLQDDRGQQYAGTVSVLGTQLGVTGAVLVTETYDGSGASLALVMEGASISTSSETTTTVPGMWRVNFVDNRIPGVPGYTVNAKIAPEVTAFGELVISKAGGSPGLRYIKLLIDRGGRQSALYGAEFADGVQRLAENDFRAKLAMETGAEELAAPPDFPTATAH